jgi:hypothetical protein
LIAGTRRPDQQGRFYLTDVSQRKEGGPTRDSLGSDRTQGIRGDISALSLTPGTGHTSHEGAETGNEVASRSTATRSLLRCFERGLKSSVIAGRPDEEVGGVKDNLKMSCLCAAFKAAIVHKLMSVLKRHVYIWGVTLLVGTRTTRYLFGSIQQMNRICLQRE